MYFCELFLFHRHTTTLTITYRCKEGGWGDWASTEKWTVPFAFTSYCLAAPPLRISALLNFALPTCPSSVHKRSDRCLRAEFLQKIFNLTMDSNFYFSSAKVSRTADIAFSLRSSRFPQSSISCHLWIFYFALRAAQIFIRGAFRYELIIYFYGVHKYTNRTV